MPALLERPKMTRAMYEALKRHIMHEREKKKQAEQEQDAMMERLRKERELRKKKEEEDSLTLEQTKEQIAQLEDKLEILKKQKSELFSQLKKVLYQEEETRRRALQKEQSELTISQPSYQHPALSTAPQPMMMHGRPALYKPTVSAPILTGMKRQRSPSPPPQSTSSSYQGYSHSEAKYAHTSDKYTHGEPKYQSHADSKFVHADPKFTHADSKYLASYPGAKAAQSSHLYTQQHAQPGDFKSSAYQQASTSHLYAANPSFQQQTAASSAGGLYPSSQPTGNKYAPPGQSAFTSYQSPFAQSHPQKALAEQFSAGYPIQRMQQPGYHTSLQLQQSMEQSASKQPGFEEKYKLAQVSQSQIRGMVPPQPQPLITQALQLQQAKTAASFVPGYSARSQQPPPGPNYPTSTSSSTYSNQTSNQGRPGYGNQSHGRYF
uniref:G protein pathway suppressor 2 n=1 Tax=Arion vulgaris TaxID=1028688 RepID=A0A0B6ZVC0_9EUPU